MFLFLHLHQLELVLIAPTGEKVGVDLRTNETFESSFALYSTDGIIQDPLAEDYEPSDITYKSLAGTDLPSGIYRLTAVGTQTGEYTLSGTLHTSEGESHYFEFTATTSDGQVDTFEFNLQTGEVKEVEEDDQENEVLDRDTFIALVKEATKDERLITRKLLLLQAHAIFDSIEKDREKLALLKLRLFETVLKVKKIKYEPLNTAIKNLEVILKE